MRCNASLLSSALTAWSLLELHLNRAGTFFELSVTERVTGSPSDLATTLVVEKTGRTLCLVGDASCMSLRAVAPERKAEILFDLPSKESQKEVSRSLGEKFKYEPAEFLVHFHFPELSRAEREHMGQIFEPVDSEQARRKFTFSGNCLERSSRKTKDSDPYFFQHEKLCPQGKWRYKRML